MTNKQQNFKEELKALFIKNRESLPEMSDDVFDSMLTELFNTHDALFGTTMESKEDLLEAAQYIFMCGALYNTVLATTYHTEMYQGALELSDNKTIQSIVTIMGGSID